MNHEPKPKCWICDSHDVEPHVGGLDCRNCGAPHGPTGDVEPYPWHVPDAVATRLETVDATCHACGHEFQAAAAVFLNLAQHPRHAFELAHGRLNPTACPKCETVGNLVPEETVVHDPRAWVTVHLRGRPAPKHVRDRKLPGQTVQGHAADAIAVRDAWLAEASFPVALDTFYGQPVHHTAENTRNHAFAAGVPLSWPETYLLLVIAGNPTWREESLARRLGGPIDAVAGPVLDRLTERHAIDVDVTPTGRILSANRRFFRGLSPHKTQSPEHTVDPPRRPGWDYCGTNRSFL